MADYAGIILSYLMTPLMWGVLIFIFLLGTVGILWLRKKRRLQFPTIEIVDLGQGKFCFNKMKSGYYGSTMYLNGLWWSGEQVLRTSDGDIIHNFSTQDFQEVDGDRGVVCYRSPLRQNILVPISSIAMKGTDMLADIAPADYTDTAINIIKDASNEVNDWKDKLIQFAGWALVIIFSLVAIIVITQMIKSGQDKSAQLLLQAGTEGAKACKDICSEAANIVASKVGNAP